MKYQRMRNEMVTNQIIARGISDPRVLDAMRSVPRHLFVSEAMMDQPMATIPCPSVNNRPSPNLSSSPR
nr:hypothetical protein [Desulfosarcina cetonica]